MTPKHTEDCSQARLARLAWAIKWPFHCDKCEGRGGWASPGSFSEPPDGDPCEECVCQGRCPRCAAVRMDAQWWRCTKTDTVLRYYAVDSDMFICPNCGWNEEEPDAMPDAECNCWEATFDNVFDLDDIGPVMMSEEELETALASADHFFEMMRDRPFCSPIQS